MKIEGDSIVDTVIKFAKQHFGVEMEVEDVSKQLKELSFANNLEIIDVIKNDDVNGFQELIQVSTNEAYGTATTAGASRATIRKGITAQDQASRASKAASAQRGGGYSAAPAGAKSLKATGARQSTDPDDAERANNANVSQTNASEIERLKDVVGKLMSRRK